MIIYTIYGHDASSTVDIILLEKTLIYFVICDCNAVLNQMEAFTKAAMKTSLHCGGYKQICLQALSHLSKDITPPRESARARPGLGLGLVPGPGSYPAQALYRTSLHSERNADVRTYHAKFDCTQVSC